MQKCFVVTLDAPIYWQAPNENGGILAQVNRFMTFLSAGCSHHAADDR
jgi:hypothetical protein